MIKNGSNQTCKYCVERRNLVLGGVTLLASTVANPWLAVAQTSHSDGPRKINVSGRQRMLIQRTGKLICLAHLTPQPLPLFAAAEETLALHQRTQAGLRDGDQELGLEPEANASVLKALSQAERVFAPYGEVIRDALKGRAVRPQHLREMTELNGPALNAMDLAVSLIERTYKSKELSEQLAMLINIAGRQRMLTQRMVLLLCLYRSTQGAGSLRQELFRTMNRFSVSLNILQRVSPAEVSDKIQESLLLNLNTAQEKWDTIRILMSRVARPTSDQSFDDMMDVDRQAEDLLTNMNEIVLLFEGASR